MGLGLAGIEEIVTARIIEGDFNFSCLRSEVLVDWCAPVFPVLQHLSVEGVTTAVMEETTEMTALVDAAGIVVARVGVGVSALAEALAE